MPPSTHPTAPAPYTTNCIATPLARDLFLRLPGFVAPRDVGRGVAHAIEQAGGVRAAIAAAAVDDDGLVLGNLPHALEQALVGDVVRSGDAPALGQLRCTAHVEQERTRFDLRVDLGHVDFRDRG